ncbi:hypothetical protein [Thiohalomonas denitrificans]|uniref:hypothetical protein n=1 Tax=Thiohalomonas denitrificans TaxID=415747 RepID=UPI0026EDA28A|nr:hypothetical protein [Thiohalomonas denitrificans]
MSAPVIKTAIPKRRYQFGEFLVTVLGEVESGDGVDYRYIMAVVQEANPKPNLFLSIEPNGGEIGEGRWALRVSMPDGSEVIGASDQWGDLDTFTREGLTMVQKMLALEDETAYRLA